MRKLTILFAILMIVTLGYCAGTGKATIVKNPPPYTLIYQDTLSLWGSDSDTLDYQLFYGGNFCNGLGKITIMIDTLENVDVVASTSTATDSVFCIYYPGITTGIYTSNCDTLLFNDQSSRTAGFSWTSENRYFANLGNITNPLPRSSILRLLVEQISADGDSINVIIRLEMGLEK